MREIIFGDTAHKAELGDKVHLQGQVQEVVKCQESGVLMLNIDANQLEQGDLGFIKLLGLTISNPETEEPIALGIEVKKRFAKKLADWFEDENDTDDEPFFVSNPSRSSGWSFGGSSFGGGFGGFGGDSSGK